MITRSKLDKLSQDFMDCFPEFPPRSLDEFLYEFQEHLSPAEYRIGMALMHAYPEYGNDMLLDDTDG
ncbi:MAG: hypothetical protein LPK02_07095 [Rhodobacterales bacterium]|nr:hypothetical protein [Rhodobacterales bacterium]